MHNILTILLQAQTNAISGKIEVVIAVIAALFVGVVAYLVYLDKKIKKLEDK
ncbi:MAG: hypothetical protein H3C45_10830 [Bacteroidia bacterium]|nr:hypothetical protein [Bacteroidia bacterium]MCC7534341.1 hypothetical protein [Bacteroidia bacterium]MCZ2139843.1 hypothetical protein [Bacteroidia bacterium]